MKIAYLVKNIDSRSGGGRYAHEVINRTKALGHEVVVLKEDDDGLEGKVILKRGVGIIGNFFKLRNLTKDCDIVHAFDVWPYSVHGYLAVLWTKKKLFVNGVGTYSVLPLNSFFKKQLLTVALKRANHIFCISEYTKREMLKRVNLNNISVVHLGFSPLPHLSDEKKKIFQEKYRLNEENRLMFLTVGAIKDRKGQFDTLQALQKIIGKYPNFLYVMVGTTDEQPYIKLIETYAREHKMEKNILMISDAKTDEELSFFYDACDVFVMNSNNSFGHFEGFGLVFLEAEQFGKPVIGSGNCGIEDAVGDGFNGFLTRQGDHGDIAQKIEKVLTNKERMGKNSLEFVKNFSWDKTVEKYLEAYIRP